MSDDDSSNEERTEEATERRKSEAIEKGHVLRSKELTTTVVLLTAASLLLIRGESMVAQLINFLNHSLTLDRHSLFDTNFMFKHLHLMSSEFLNIIMPIFIILVVAAVGSAFALGGVHFNIGSVNFKASRLSLFSGLKRMVSVKGFIEVVKAIFKLILIGFFGYLILKHKIHLLFTLDQLTLSMALAISANVLGWSLLWLSAALLFVSCFDVPMQWWNYQQELKMTKQQVRDESKDSEGNPEIKSRIRKMQMQLSRQRMMAAVPTADVVITNPTHYAVALRYDQSKQKIAPIVVARGKDLLALQIRKIAEENAVKVLEVPSLARSIYFHTKLDEEIPFGLYVAVAQVLAYVYQLKRYEKGKGKKPPIIPEPPIPDYLRK